VTAPETKCKRCSKPVNPAVWPGDEGWCSGICRALDEIEEQQRETRRALLSIDTIARFGGLR
jgi:predicted nucleic acid-binding Zn ribbon protein